MEPGPVPVDQQEARCRAREEWVRQAESGGAKGRCPGQKRGREASQPARARLPLCVEHMGRVPVEPVLEVGVAWAL